jgi:hypothetical protein
MGCSCLIIVVERLFYMNLLLFSHRQIFSGVLLAFLLVFVGFGSQSFAFWLPKIVKFSDKTVQPVSRPTVPVAHSFQALSQQRFSATSSAKHLQLIGVNANEATLQTLLATIAEMTKAANAHDTEQYLSHYATSYVSGDNLDYNQIKGLIGETWQLYPSIQYGAELIEIRMNGRWATVESIDMTKASGIPSPFSMSATAAEARVASNDASAPKTPVDPSTQTGELVTQARNLIFFHRVGDVWLVQSDRTLYETACLRFGNTEGLNIQFNAPDQVFSNEGYTATVEASLPENTLAMATVNREPLIFPHPKAKDVLRMMGGQKTRLERVFEANGANRNEMVSVSMGFLSGMPKSNGVNFDLSGLITLVKRVNVVPKATQDVSLHKVLSDVVKTSANGKIDVTKNDKPSGIAGGAAKIPLPLH